MPQLQATITQLESELQQYRYKDCVRSGVNRGIHCMGVFVHPITHHLPLCFAYLKVNDQKLQVA